MRSFKLTALEAIRTEKLLNTNQLFCLKVFAPYGLTIEEAKSLKPNCALTSENKDIALYLVNKKNYDIVDAINEVAGKTDEQLAGLIKKNVTRLPKH